ncbi:MAG: TRAP transporter large permease subunit [Candidatus Coatesbacteria bacterium]
MADDPKFVKPAEAAEVPTNGPEPWISLVLLAGMALLPLWDIVSRLVGTLRIPGSSAVVQHLTLMIAFAGGALAARAGKLLTLSTTSFLPGWFRAYASPLAAAAGTAVCGVLAVSSTALVQADRVGGEILTMGIPIWTIELVLPLGYAAIAACIAWLASPSWRGRAVAASGLLVPILLAYVPALQTDMVRNAGIVVLLVATVSGLPLFACLGGLALILFWGAGVPLASVPAETYRLAANPMLPAIPLFTLAGHVLSAGGACRRLVRVFGALVGWMPGGLAIVTTVVFAFFASFTGASGVTILSLGGLLYPVLRKSKYPEGFAVGLMTATGSIGLLFPPSLPVILYGVRSLTIINGVPYVAPIDELFIAGLIPGLFLVGLVSLWGVRQARRAGVEAQAFDAREAWAAMREAVWELVIPVAILIGYFGGFTTLVEIAAITLVWAVIAECWIYGDLDWRKDLLHVTADGAALVGGVLLILGAALGFTNFLVDARAPEWLAGFVKLHVTSKIVFLLLLNVFMLIVGSIIEIYSAILVVVPLLAPMGAAFGIHPVHLGIIFLANLELGYLMPPVGLNLLLSSYRFNRPMAQVAKDTFPFLLIMTAGVLLITYVPWMSLGLLHLLRGTP